ncbi:MAG: ribonuclease P protein subunit [archaeon]|nr:MAG: ribonuclease P protein subunit [archaeon]
MNRKDLEKHEFIGMRIEVLESDNKSQKGIRGKVIDETQKMLKIESGGKEKNVPKRGSIFRFTLTEGVKVKIVGDKIAARPEERIRKC